MAASTVGTDYAAVVQELYISYFGRPADYYGLTSFEAALVAAQAPTDFATLNSTLQAGTNSALTSLVNSFSSSAESIALYGSGTDTISISKFVNAIYNNVLNRDADTSGLTFWVNAITSGELSQADAAVAITAAATANTTAQGLIDAAVVANKVSVAGTFTGDLTTASQINGYSGDAAAAAARGLLADVTDTTDLVAFQATITSTINSIVSGTGTSTALTIGEDNFTGTSANDIFTAATAVSATGTTVDTLTSLDVIDGGAGNNTLKATLVTAGEAPTLKNIENVELRFVGGSLDLVNSTGVTTVVVANSTLDGSVANVGALTTIGVSDQNANVAITGLTSKTVSVALDTFGVDATASTLSLNNKATTINLTTNNSAAAVTSGALLKTLTVGATGASEIAFDSASLGSITSVTVTGTGTLTLDGAYAAVTKFDASGNSGGVTAELGATVKTVVGSSAADAITLDGTTSGNKASVNLGAGDDVLTLAGVVAGDAVIDGGAGTNTLVINGAADLASFTTAAEFKAGFLDFQTLELAGSATIDASIFTGFTSYIADSGTIVLSDLSATTAVTVDGTVASLTLSTVSTVTDVTTIADTLTLSNGATSAAAGVEVTSLTTDAATLTIHSGGLVTASTGFNTVILDGAEANLTSVVIDGSQAIHFTTGALAGNTLSIDASTATGVVTVDASAATELVNINGGTAADVITGGTAGGAIYGGAGGDTITLTGGGVDTIVYKAVTDSVYSVTASGVLGSGIDTITGFVTGTDKIDLTGLALTSTSVIVDKTAASLTALTTLAATSSFYNDSTGTARSVVEVTVGTDSYLFIDANKDHKFDASTDLVIKLAGVTSIAAADLIFG